MANKKIGTNKKKTVKAKSAKKAGAAKKAAVKMKSAKNVSPKLKTKAKQKPAKKITRSEKRVLDKQTPMLENIIQGDSPVMELKTGAGIEDMSVKNPTQDQ